MLLSTQRRSSTTTAAVLITSLLLAACTKKDEATKSTPASGARPASATVTGDGGSMAGPIGLVLGKPVEGVLRCPAPTWFVVVPPVDAQAKLELQIPKGSHQYCTHLNARDATGKVVDATLLLCSDSTDAFSSMQAPFSKDVTYFTIDQNDPNEACVPARFRLSLVASK